jgi:hypothetical protein
MTATPKIPLGQVILKKIYLINFFKHNMEQDYIVFEKPFILFLQNILQWKKIPHTVPKYNR